MFGQGVILYTVVRGFLSLLNNVQKPGRNKETELSERRSFQAKRTSSAKSLKQHVLGAAKKQQIVQWSLWYKRKA
jgi:hypothetical protein